MSDELWRKGALELAGMIARKDDGTPVGAQLVGRKFADLTCLRAAEQLEELFGTITPIDPVR